MTEYYGKRDCQNCIWHDTSCTKFYCQQITRKQITNVLKIIEVCDAAIVQGIGTEEAAKTVAYEHIVNILKGSEP